MDKIKICPILTAGWYARGGALDPECFDSPLTLNCKCGDHCAWYGTVPNEGCHLINCLKVLAGSVETSHF